MTPPNKGWKMSCPIILLVKDEFTMEYRYTLKIPFSYIVKVRNYKMMLSWWMLKLLWREIWRSGR